MKETKELKEIKELLEQISKQLDALKMLRSYPTRPVPYDPYPWQPYPYQPYPYPPNTPWYTYLESTTGDPFPSDTITIC